jgi:hypothetical protein
MARLRSALINSMLVIVAVAACVAIAFAADAWLNLGLRYAVATLFQQNVQQPEPIMYVYDNATGWRLNPFTQYHRSRSGPFFGLAGVERYDTRLRVNSEGFIDREHYLETPYYRIAFAGNSWVEAVQQEYTDRFAPLTEDYVFDRSKQSKAVEIMNFGMSNAAPAQAYGIIRKHALKYRPDEVWLFITAADLRANTPLDTPPPFGATFEYADAARTSLKDIRFGFPDPPAVANWKRSREIAAFDPAALIFGRVMPYHYSTERDPVYERVWGDFRLVMALMKKTLSAQGIRLRVVYIPPRYEIDPRLWEDFRRQARQSTGKELPMETAIGEKRFAALMQEQGIEFISLTALCKEKGPAEMYSDHFSRMGHHWVADYLARVVIETIPDSPKTKPQ